MRLAILGAGSWGTALAAVLAGRHEVTLYARDEARRGELEALRENRRYLPGVSLPPALVCSSDLRASVDGADLVFIATPVAALRALCVELRSVQWRGLVWLCKGFEAHSGLLPGAVVTAVLPEARAGALFGPSFAREVAQGRPTALTIAAPDTELQQLVVDAVHGGALRVYRSADVIGVDVGGAVKNVMAIATGVSDGLDLGLNSRAALITRGLSEMMRFGEVLGGRPETLMGLTGVGDLILTCTGALSRNRQVGIALARGESLAGILDRLGHVAEGVQSARTVRDLARRLGVEMPITEAVCSLLFEGVAPSAAVALLLARTPRAE